MNKNTRNFIVLVIFILIIGLIVYPKLNLSGGAKQNNSLNNKPKEKPFVKVKVMNYSPLEDKISANGTILPNEEVQIRAEISGKITAILFKEGDYVGAGTALVTIYNEELKAQLRKLESSKKLIETKEYRQKKLLEKEAISQQEYDIALNELNAINAEIEVLKEQIKKTTILAPFDGFIGLRMVSMGAYISPNTTITNLTNLNPAKVQFAIPAKYSSMVSKGNTIKFSTENNTQLFEGKVYAIEPKIDEATRTIQIKAICPNPDKALTPGAFVKIDLVTRNINDALMLPTEAVIPEADSYKVFVIKQGKAQPKQVVVGNRTETEVQITKGLDKGDTVVTSGIIKLKKDIPVQIKEVI